MGVVVFDSDVLIGFLNADDAHHDDAVGLVRAALRPGNRRLLNAVNYSEISIGALRAETHERVDEMLARLGVEIIPVDPLLARRAASVSAETGLALPDAYAVATAMHAESRGWGAATVASFDKRVRRAASAS